MINSYLGSYNNLIQKDNYIITFPLKHKVKYIQKNII